VEREPKVTHKMPGTYSNYWRNPVTLIISVLTLTSGCVQQAAQETLNANILALHTFVSRPAVVSSQHAVFKLSEIDEAAAVLCQQLMSTSPPPPGTRFVVLPARVQGRDDGFGGRVTNAIEEALVSHGKLTAVVDDVEANAVSQRLEKYERTHRAVAPPASNDQPVKDPPRLPIASIVVTTTISQTQAGSDEFWVSAKMITLFENSDEWSVAGPFHIKISPDISERNPDRFEIVAADPELLDLSEMTEAVHRITGRECVWRRVAERPDPSSAQVQFEISEVSFQRKIATVNNIRVAPLLGITLSLRVTLVDTIGKAGTDGSGKLLKPLSFRVLLQPDASETNPTDLLKKAATAALLECSNDGHFAAQLTTLH
jgi:hypothetical protein